MSNEMPGFRIYMYLPLQLLQANSTTQTKSPLHHDSVKLFIILTSECPLADLTPTCLQISDWLDDSNVRSCCTVTIPKLLCTVLLCFICQNKSLKMIQKNSFSKNN